MMAATRKLGSSPSLLPLYLRAAAPLVPGASRLPGLPGHGKQIPATELRLDNVEVQRGSLEKYVDVCGFTPGVTLPPTYPHVLAFPLHMALMTDSSFPFGPVGLVHVENSITQQRPLRLAERLSFAVRATPLEPHPRGKTFSIVTEARAGDELVWEERSTMLRRGRGEPGARREAEAEPPATTTEWQLPGDTGRRYAAASGDRNPIHMHPLTAKAFGFPRAIAHGMWAKARCLAELAGELPEAFTVDVSFRKPILLPGRVAFGSAASDFVLRGPGDGPIHLTGHLGPARREQT